MADAIIAVNKALGLESWPMHGATSCIDRGGQGITAKDVKPDDARKCAATAIDKGFPELGKSYVLAILMAHRAGHRHRARHRRGGRLGRLLRATPNGPASR